MLNICYYIQSITIYYNLPMKNNQLVPGNNPQMLSFCYCATTGYFDEEVPAHPMFTV